MDTAIHIFPSRHVPLTWSVLEASIRRWSGDNARALWGDSIQLCARVSGGHHRLLGEDPLDMKHAYRIDLAGDDYGPWINYHSLQDRADPHHMIEVMGAGLSPDAIDEIAENVRRTGYFLVVLTRPAEQPFISRLKVAACAVAELVAGTLGIYGDEFDGMRDGVYRLDEFKDMQLPYRESRAWDDFAEQD